ncbi:hypothetical protein [Sulfitobacter sp. M22]|uniref:hypothetical protein n=1 Tax=Sulfitobacter sp. M22 TaxID=2675332 RepID=UPI001F16D053|nr:hypothetical protein [Sulfitobacter sp. M22]MCF7728697.1 hypothetical protein [Sulfitobacter sp. M22]
MSYFVAFVDDVDTPFDAALHAVKDLEAFSVNISQREGEYASCELETLNPGVSEILSIEKPHVLISCDDRGEPELIFRGTITGIPTELLGEYIVLEILASRTAEDLRELGLTLQETGELNPLFVDLEEATNDDLIRGRACHYYVDRRTRDLKLSDDVAPASIVDVDSALAVSSSQIFEGSLSLRLGELPPEKVVQKFDVEWIQRREGIMDLAPVLNERLGVNGAISIETLTPEYILQALPGVDFMPNAEGYTILDVQKFAHRGGQIGDNRTFDRTEPRSTYNTHFGFSESVVVPVYLEKWHVAYKKFSVHYLFTQGRVEHCFVEAIADHSSIIGHSGLIETLPDLVASDVTVDNETEKWVRFKTYQFADSVMYGGRRYHARENHKATYNFDFSKWTETSTTFSAIVDQGSPTFLTETTGKSSQEYALHLASAEMRRRSRFIEISFSMEFLPALDISTDTVIEVSHELIPGGRAYGKVVNYSLNDNGSERSCDISLLVAVSNAAPALNSVFQGEYVDAKFVESGYQEEVSNDFSIDIPSSQTFTVSQPVAVEAEVVSSVGLPNFISNEFLVETATMTGGRLTDQMPSLDDTMLSPTWVKPPYHVAPGKVENVYVLEKSDDPWAPEVGNRGIQSTTVDYEELATQVENDVATAMRNEEWSPTILVEFKDLMSSQDVVERNITLKTTVEVESGLSL